MFIRSPLVRGSRPSLAAVLVAGTLLGAAACSGGTSAPQALPPLHSTPPTTAAPSTAPTRSPRSAKQVELAAATAVVRRYYAVLNNLHNNMNAAGFAAVFSAYCPCQAQVRAVRSAASRHEHYIDRVRLIKLIANLDGNGRVDVLVDFKAARGGLVAANGHQLTSLPPQRHVRRDFELGLKRGRWLIDQIDSV